MQIAAIIAEPSKAQRYGRHRLHTPANRGRAPNTSFTFLLTPPSYQDLPFVRATERIQAGP